MECKHDNLTVTTAECDHIGFTFVFECNECKTIVERQQQTYGDVRNEDSED